MRTKQFFILSCLIATVLVGGGRDKPVQRFSGEILKIGDNSIVVRSKEGESKKLEIEAELVKKAGLQEKQEITLFYRPKEMQAFGAAFVGGHRRSGW